MNVTVTRALELMREADPAREMVPVEPGALSEAWRAACDRGETEEFTFDSPRRPNWGRRFALAAVAAAVVVGVAVAVAVVPLGSSSHTGSGSATVARSAPEPRPSTPSTPVSSEPASEPSFGPTGTLGPSDDPNFARTLALVEGYLAEVPTLPGAVRASRAPTSALDRPLQVEQDGNLIDRAGFWTAAGSVADAVAYLKAHPPAGFSATGWASSGPVNDPATVEQEIMFSGPDSGNATSAQVSFSIVAFGSGVAVRADASAIWTPTKPATDYLGTVSSVDVVVNRNRAAPTVRRTLTGAVAQRLADAIDALPVATAGVIYCPVEFGFTDQLVFHGAGRTIDVNNEVDGCEGLTVSVDGVQQTHLAGSVNDLVMADLGLPSNYGYGHGGGPAG